MQLVITIWIETHEERKAGSGLTAALKFQAKHANFTFMHVHIVD